MLVLSHLLKYVSFYSPRMHCMCAYLALLVVSLLMICLGHFGCGALLQKKTQNEEACYDTDVIVLGAGVVGAAFVKHLALNGIKDFLVLEARDEPGGRFQNIIIGNISVELGANWVHGTENNPIYKLIKKYGIAGKFEDQQSLICRDSKGRNCTASFLKIRKKLKDILWTLGEEYNSISLRDALLKNGWQNRTSMENIVEYSVIDFMDAAPPEVLSGNYYHSANATINSLYGSQLFITEQRGYKKLVQGLLEETIGQNSTKLKLSNFVKKIKWGKNGVRVETSNGKIYSSKVLLVTLSMGVLQNVKNLFEPELPAWKKAAIEKFKMGTYTKIFLKFPYRFWDNVEYIFYASGTRHRFPVWQSLDAHNRFQVDTNILMVTVTESESYRIEELSKEKLIDEILAELKLIYGSNVPKPVETIVPIWNKNELFYGSYSLFQPNVTHQDFVAVRANVGPLFFAGEATHELYQGYIHGAYYEGENRAYDVRQALHGYLSVKDDKLNREFYNSCLRNYCHVL